MMIRKNKKTNLYDVRFYKDGKDIRKKGFRTKREAEDFIRDKIAEIKGNLADTDRIITLVEIFLNKRKTRIKASTYEKDERILNKYVVPYFTYTYQINMHSINEWKNKIVKLGFKEHYINQLIECFRRFLNYTSKLVRIDANAIEELDSVKLYEVKEEMKIWSVDEFNQFLSVVDNSFYYTLFSTLFWSGLRISELRALTKNDVVGNELIVNKRLDSKTKASKGITTLKTQSSHRRVLLDDDTIALLNKLEADGKDYLFPISETQIRRMLDKYIKKASVKKIPIHSFRHSHASWLIRKGCNLKMISERLGHSSADVTLRYYFHLLPKEQDKLIDLIQGEKKNNPKNT